MKIFNFSILSGYNDIMNKTILLLFLFPILSYAQQPEKAKTELTVEELEIKEFESVKTQRLKRIRTELIRLTTRINELKKELDQDADMVTRLKSEPEIRRLKKEYDKQRFLFIETITNINFTDHTKKRVETTFSEDIKEILEPALNTFKKVSERPRQIQALQEEKELLDKRYSDAKNAIKKLEDFQVKNKHKSLKYKLKESLKVTKKILNETKVKLEDIQFKIIKMEKNEKSIVSTFSILILEFIKTKGKNLFLAFIVFLTFFWLSKLGQNRFINLVLYRVSRSENKEIYAWVVRPTRVIYTTVTTLVAFFMSILTLYVLNDWLLVTLIIILFCAIIWSSKQYIPLFLEQTKIVLNLGSVREGERVMFDGLPWRIDQLGYYCKLSNPYLSSGRLRVNTKELISAHSRRAEESEPWFPTQVNDWVEVEEVYGKVIFQSPDQVILELPGGENRYYTAKDFYSKQIYNFSRGFAVEFFFGVDYNLQEELFDKVLPKFQSGIENMLYQKHPELQGKVHKIEVGFHLANASSLDLRFFMVCSGEVSHLKLILERSIQAEFVKICNENSYVIPFQQLTVHMHDNK